MGNTVPFLECSNVSKTFGVVKALNNVQLSCNAGEVHCILGENGAGKSTLIKILCGVYEPDPGAVIKLDGQEVKFNSPIDAAAKGVAAVFQELSIISGLSVADNIYLGLEPKKKNGQIDYKKLYKDTQEILDYVGLDIDPQERAGDLPVSKRQLIEVCKALAKQPKVMIFDEPTSSLSKEEVEILFRLIFKLKEEGRVLIYISHRMSELAQIADAGSVFRDSNYIASFRWGEASNEQIINWIVGRKVSDVYPERHKVTSEEIALEVRGLERVGSFFPTSLKVRKGEIMGIAGLQGHGQVPFLNTIFGITPADAGEVYLNGKRIDVSRPARSIKNSVALVPDERKNDGLMLKRSVKENMMLMTLDRRSPSGILSYAKEKADYERMKEIMNIKAENMDIDADALSGGNQQKIVIGKILLTDAQVILLADPTKGIDIGAKSEIYKTINDLADMGKTVLLYSTEMEEIIALSNRVAVFRAGRVAGILDEKDINEAEIIKLSMGIGEEGGAENE
ncbi:MAG: sugar ABC transporter ATP-binding protein [Lachnospiraceae bacterium]|nr:sugar ABC transporter ATP-binding protein [Lachnospiraceae bacterium]